MAAMFNWKEKPGIGARSSERRADFSLGEMNRLAGQQVRGNNREWNPHLPEIFRFGKTAKEILETLIGSHAHARKRPATKIAEASEGSLTRHFVERSSAGIRCGDQCADACASDVVDRNFVLFQDAQHANMRDAAGESAA